jgi:hypothetical protein
MQPLYFDPLDSSGNYIGTNPLQTTGISIRTTEVTIDGTIWCHNPSLYQPYTFFDSPFYPYSYNGPSTYLKSTLIGSNSFVSSETTMQNKVFLFDTYATDIGIFALFEYYSTQIFYSSQFFTFYSTYAGSYQIDPVTFSVRFGTQLQTLYASTSFATNVIATYENIYTEQIYWYYLGDNDNNTKFSPVESALLASGLFSSFIVQTTQYQQADGLTVLGSSNFVNMLGSNVYSALLDTTNSVIIYQNEQISSYYSQALSYQINVINLTAALNSVSGNSPDNTGNGTITVTFFSWAWESSVTGWTGSQIQGYTMQETVNSYLFYTYAGAIVTNSSLAITQVQSLLSIQNNNLANSQTLLNNAVTTLQSQVSLAGQIITALASGMETLINNI